MQEDLYIWHENSKQTIPFTTLNNLKIKKSKFVVINYEHPVIYIQFCQEDDLRIGDIKHI